jgi:hypothetical protein
MIPQTPQARTPVQLSKLLLVEGDTPMHFFEALLRHLGLHDQVEVRKFGGNTDLRGCLDGLVATSEFKQLVRSVGVIRDAEDDARSAYQSASDALTAAGLTPTRTPPIRTAIFILPDGQNPGKIETLCVQSVMNDLVYSCVEEFFACVQRQKGQLPAKFDQAKAYAQAFLSTQEDVQLFPGLAAYRRYWPWGSPVFDPLKQFLQSL